MALELKSETIALAAEMKKGIKIDYKEGDKVTATVDDDLYMKSLPEGLTEATLKAVSKHNSNFIAAGSLALGEMTLPLMKKESELNTVNLVIPTVGGDKIDIQFDRTKMTGAPGAERTEKFGHLTAGYTMRGARPVGQLAAVKQHLANLASETLNHKKK